MPFHYRKMKGLLNKKAQLRIGDAPGVVLIALFLFMIMGTSAFVLEKYQEGFGSDISGKAVNETVTQTELKLMTGVDASSNCNFGTFVVTQVINATVPNSGENETIHSGNYSITDSGTITNLTSEYALGPWNVTYTYEYSGIACNITEELAGEVEDNVSIAGMVLTIALIGIVLSILIGLFYVFTGRKGVGGM